MAAIPTIGGIEYPTPDEVRSTLLAQIRYGYATAGVTVNVEKDSELWHRITAISGRVSQAIQNGRAGLLNTNPLRATGDALVEWARLFGVVVRPAASAAGFAKIALTDTTKTITVPIGFVCTHTATGIKYKTTGPNTSKAHGSTVKVQAVSAGKNTDADPDDRLQWDKATVPFLDQIATVDVGGIDGGADADGEETLRARLLRKLGLPAVGGNPAHTVQLAEDASAGVRAAFSYPSILGPASYGVAVIGPADDIVLGSATTDAVAKAVKAEKPGYARANITSVTKEELDVIINLSAPLPRFAGGAGNGWIDAVPWPSIADAGVYAEVTAFSVILGTVTVDSTSADAPVVGRRFMLWDPTIDTTTSKPKGFKQFAVAVVAGSSGAYVITVDAPGSELGFVQLGMYCTAAHEHAQEYADVLIEAMADMGPGEKSADADILQYARRFPSPDVQHPYSLTSTQLTAVQKSFGEILGIAFAARFETGTSVTRTTPSVPSMTKLAPNQLTIKHLSFRSEE